MESRRLRQTGNRLGGRIAVFPMDPEESWDVDAEADLNIVEALLQRLVDNDH
jgi:CMP-N-acetylneuraminic acid synthetase